MVLVYPIFSLKVVIIANDAQTSINFKEL